MPNKNTSCVEERLDSRDKVKNGMSPMKDPLNNETQDSDTVFPLPAQDEPQNNPPSVINNLVIDKPDEKIYSSAKNDPFMVH